MEGAAPIPILDEYDFTGVQLGTFSDVFSEDENGRIFALWLSTDRRASITLQKETSRNIGRRLSLVVNGQSIAFHPIEKTITNGYIPFLFMQKIPEEQVMEIYNRFRESLIHLKAELEDLRNWIWNWYTYFSYLMLGALFLSVLGKYSLNLVGQPQILPLSPA